MKKIKFFVLFVFFLEANISFAQYVSVTAGAKFLDFKSKTVDFFFVDDSPSRDNIYTNVDMKADKVLNLAVTVDNLKKSQNIYYDLNLEGFFGKYFGLDLSASLGYPLYLSNKKISIIPTISGGYGYSEKEIGTIINNDVYIQVNNTKYKNYTNVDASLRRQYFLVRPSLNLFFDLSKKIQLRINTAYTIPFSMVDEAIFTGKDGNDKSITETKDLNGNNVAFYVDGLKSSSIPFSTKGLEIKIGLGFFIGKTSNK